MIELGTFLLRRESELILTSRQVVPGRLLDAGCEFSYPTWPEAPNELVDRWSNAKPRAMEIGLTLGLESSRLCLP